MTKLPGEMPKPLVCPLPLLMGDFRHTIQRHGLHSSYSTIGRLGIPLRPARYGAHARTESCRHPALRNSRVVPSTLRASMDEFSGDPACWLDAVCDRCGGFIEPAQGHRCRAPVTEASLRAGGRSAEHGVDERIDLVGGEGSPRHQATVDDGPG